MKKYLFVALMAILCLNASAQAVKFDLDTDGSVMVLDTKILDNAKLSKDTLYTITKNWFANIYEKASSIIQIDDRTNGHILAKAEFPYYTGQKLKYTIEVFVKDNKYRIYIHDITFDSNNFTDDYKDYLLLMAKDVKKAKEKYEMEIETNHLYLNAIIGNFDRFIKKTNDKSEF